VQTEEGGRNNELHKRRKQATAAIQFNQLIDKNHDRHATRGKKRAGRGFTSKEMKGA
jgi:ribosomal protein L13E